MNDREALVKIAKALDGIPVDRLQDAEKTIFRILKERKLVTTVVEHEDEGELVKLIKG